MLHGYIQFYSLHKQKTFMQILQKMLKQDLTLQIMKHTGLYLKRKIKK